MTPLVTWVFAILLVLAMGGVAAAAAGRGAGLADDEDDLGAPSAAETPLDAAGLRGVRFPLALRGYRMADVDALLDRLALREAERERPAADQDEPVSDR